MISVTLTLVEQMPNVKMGSALVNLSSLETLI